MTTSHFRYKRRGEVERFASEAGTTRCGRCGWAHEGAFSAGIEAARSHRRSAHHELPERSPARVEPRRTDELDKIRSAEREQTVLAALREVGRPIRASELGDKIGIGASTVSKILRSGSADLRVLGNGLYLNALTREPETRPQPKRCRRREMARTREKRVSEVERKRAIFNAAVEQLRSTAVLTRQQPRSPLQATICQRLRLRSS